jgi:acrylyl-CoA reductase (NADPH)
MFKGIMLAKSDKEFKAELAEIDEKSLPEGNVTIRVEYSTINYKDGLAITNKAPLVRAWPMVAGIDGAGVVDKNS